MTSRLKFTEKKSEIAVVDPVDIATETGEKELFNVGDGLCDTEGDLNENTRVIVIRLREIIVERRTGYGITFMKVGRRMLKLQTMRMNKAVRYLKVMTITETNILSVTASLWVADQLRIKKLEHRKKNEPR